MRAARSGLLRRAPDVLLLPVLVCAGLSGCASGPQAVSSEVRSFTSWPAQRAPGSYVFERLPSQDVQAERQASVEAACAPALAAAGFAPASPAAPAKVSVQVTAGLRVDPGWRGDPFWSPWGPAYRYGPQGRWGPRGPFWWPSPMTDLPRVRLQLDLVVRDRAGGQVLYETRAVHERVGALDPRLLAPVCAAALADFPAPATGMREVTVTLPADPS